MAVGDGSAWDEANPQDTTVANQIDDYNRDLRIGIRSRLAREHVFPASQTATNQGGHHTLITFQAQTAAPTMAGTTAGGLFVMSSGLNLFFVDSAGTNHQVVLSGVDQTIAGTQTFALAPLITATSTADAAAVTYAQFVIAAPPGNIQMYGGSAAPAGWYVCTGANCSTGTDAALFSVIGTNYGTGGGAGMFSLPDFRNRIPWGFGGTVSGTSVGLGWKNTNYTTLSISGTNISAPLIPADVANPGSGNAADVGGNTLDPHLVVNFIIKR